MITTDPIAVNYEIEKIEISGLSRTVRQKANLFDNCFILFRNWRAFEPDGSASGNLSRASDSLRRRGWQAGHELHRSSATKAEELHFISDTFLKFLNYILHTLLLSYLVPRLTSFRLILPFIEHKFYQTVKHHFYQWSFAPKVSPAKLSSDSSFIIFSQSHKLLATIKHAKFTLGSKIMLV